MISFCEEHTTADERRRRQRSGECECGARLCASRSTIVETRARALARTRVVNQMHQPLCQATPVKNIREDRHDAAAATADDDDDDAKLCVRRHAVCVSVFACVHVYLYVCVCDGSEM